MADIGVLTARLVADTTNFVAGMRESETTLKQTTTTVAKMGTTLNDVGRTMTLGLTLPLVAFGALSYKAAADFDASMRNVTTISSYVTDNFAMMSDKIIELSKTLPQSATELADGLYDVASSGFAGAEGMTVLEGSAAAASAGLSTTATAARAITAVLNAYGMQASDTRKVSDILFQTVNLGVVTFDELAQQLGNVVGMAASAKIPIEDVGSAIATITLAGVPAAEATTSLSRLMQEFIQPSEELSKALKGLGYETGIQAVQQDGLKNVMLKLYGVVGDQTDQWLKLFPEIRAVRGALALTAAEGENYNRVAKGMATATSGVGATQKALAAQQKSAAYQLQTFKNELSALSIQVGASMVPAFRAISGIIKTLVEAFSALPKPVQTVLVGIGALVALAGPIMLVVGNMLRLNAALLEIQKTGSGFAATAAGIGSSAMTMGARIGGAAVGFLVLGSTLTQYTGSAILAGAASGALIGLTFGPWGAAAGAVVGGLAGGLGLLGGKANDTKQRLDSVVSTIEGIKSLTRVSQAFNYEAVQSGSSVQDWVKRFEELAAKSPAAAQKVLDAMYKTRDVGFLVGVQTKTIDLFAQALDRGTKKFQENTVATTQAREANQQMANTALVNAGAMTEVTAAAEDQKKAIDELKTSFDAIFGVHITAREAEIRYGQSLTELSDKIKDAKASEDDRKLSVISSTRDLENMIESMYKEGASLDEVNAKVAQHAINLRDTSFAAGATEEQVRSYLTVLGLTPKQVDTVMMADNADALAKTWDVKVRLSELAQGTHIPITADLPPELQMSLAMIARIQEASAAGLDPYAGRQVGGSVMNNTPYIVGERGPELFIPNRSGGKILTHGQTMQAFSRSPATGGGGGGIGSVVINVNGAGDPQAVAAAVRDQILEIGRRNGSAFGRYA